VSHTAPTDQGTQKTPGKEPQVVTYLTPDEQVKAAGITTIKLATVTLDGPNVQSDCEKLLNWTIATTDKTDTKHKLATLLFTWGDKIKWDVRLNSVTINYVRFTTAGQPIRAQVDLTFNSVKTAPQHTNPTSGGLPGRRSHVITAGESLQHVATANYGQPGAWRAVATENGIEDPLRVRPGAIIYLPGSEELPAGSQT
jgi:hypothetical protein